MKTEPVEPAFDYAGWQQKELSKYAYPGRMMGMIANMEQEIPIPGMTKREAFAMAAMQAMIKVKAADMHGATYHFTKNTEDCCGDVAAASIRVADETLKALEL